MSARRRKKRRGRGETLQRAFKRSHSSDKELNHNNANLFSMCGYFPSFSFTRRCQVATAGETVPSCGGMDIACVCTRRRTRAAFSYDLKLDFFLFEY